MQNFCCLAVVLLVENTECVIDVARAFLCAGARAVLASLWQVKDEVHDMLLSASSTEEELGELLRPIRWR